MKNLVNNPINNNRIFTVKFLSPTNSRGARISITEDRYNKKETKVLSYSYEIGNVLNQAIEYLLSININVVGYGEQKSNYIIFSNSWANGVKFPFVNIKGVIEE